MEIKETCISKSQGDNEVVIYTSEIKYVNKLKKLHEKHPNEVKIQERGNSVDARVPAGWFRFVSPKKEFKSTEDTDKLKARLEKAREAKKEKNNG